MSTSHYSTRRGFLKCSSAVVAGAALAGEASLARGAHAAGGTDEIRVALIGCGGRGKGAVNDLFSACSKARLVAVADVFADNARGSVAGLKKRLGARADVAPDRIFVGFDAYQKAIDCGVDLVLLAAPPGFRPLHYKAAVEAGKHVFLEKPCCVDAPGFRSLMDTNKLADEKNLKVGVGLQRRHQTPYLETLKRIQDGAIGQIEFFRVYWNSAGVWNRPRRSEQTEMEYQMRNWYYFVWLSGDHICEQHVHNMDVANWIKDAHPVEAQGMGGRQVRRFGPDGDFGHIFDHHSVEFTYADGTKLFSQCRQIPNCWPEVREFAYGTQGHADCSGRIVADKKWRFRGQAPNPYTQEHVDLVDAILHDKKYNEGYHGATSSMTAVLGRMATYSGKLVKWDEAVAGGPSEGPESGDWNTKPPVLPDKNGSYEHAVAVPGIYKPY